MLINAFPLIEVTILFLTLFYTLHIKPTFKAILISTVLIIIPSMSLLLIDKFIFIAYLTISSLIIFSYLSQSLRAYVDLCSLVLGGIISENISYRFSLLLSIDQPLRSYILFSICFTTFIIFAYFYKKFILKAYPTITFSLKARFLIVFTSSLTIFIVYLSVLLPFVNEEPGVSRIHLALELVYVSCMFILYRISAKSVKMKKELKKLEIENQQYMKYMQSLEKINKEMHKFQHDYANILLTIRGYLENEDLHGLKQYFQTHILKAEQSTYFKNEVFRNLDNLKVVELKGLLATKVIHADQLGIKLNVEIPDEIESINMDIIDLTRIIGILTDNAIEACVNHVGAQICIAFMKTCHDSILICVDNTIENVTINLNEIYQESFSTKGQNRGIGLTNVKEILKRYDTVNLSTHIEDGWFMQELDIHSKQFALTV